MGEAFITRRGGTKKPYAVIGVDYPSGSVCTCIKDGASAKTIYNLVDRAIFYVPESGTWTISITDASHSTPVTKDIIISAQGQVVNVQLQYRLQLLLGENQCTDVTGGWQASNVSSFITDVHTAPSVTYGSNGLTSALAEAPESLRSGSVGTSNNISMANYRTLHANIVQKAFMQAICVYSGGSVIASAQPTDTGAVSIDISSLTGSYIVAVEHVVAGSTGRTLTVNDIYLE